MQTQHRLHLTSTESTIRQHLAEIRKVVTTGESPGGGRSIPLPVCQRDQLLAVLDDLEASLRQMMQLLALDGEDADSKGHDRGGTQMWASLLLRTVAELVRELSPEVMARQYGGLDPCAAAALRETVPRLLQEVERGLGVLE